MPWERIPRPRKSRHRPACLPARPPQAEYQVREPEGLGKARVCPTCFLLLYSPNSEHQLSHDSTLSHLTPAHPNPSATISALYSPCPPSIPGRSTHKIPSHHQKFSQCTVSLPERLFLPVPDQTLGINNLLVLTIKSLWTYANITPTEPGGIHFFHHPLHTSLLFRTIPKGPKEQRESVSGHRDLQGGVGGVVSNWDWVRMRG